MEMVTEMVVTSRIDAQIDFNYEEAEQYLNGLLTNFHEWQIQEADLPFAKDTLAGLNKLTKSVEDFRKTTKKEMEKPIKAFEDKCKKLTGKISEVYDPLKLQYDGFEEKRRQEKQAELQDLLDQVRADSNLPEKEAARIVIKDFYANKTATKKQIIEDLWQQANEITRELQQSVEKLEYVEALCETYSIRHELQVKLDPQNFIQYEREELKDRIEQSALRMKQNEAEAIERIKKQEEAKAMKEAEKLIEETVRAVDELIVPENPEEKKLVARLEITATKSQMEAMKKYMEMNGITYSRL